MALNQNDVNPKKRTASKCREWERERRNRFNEAVSQLGQLIKQSMKNLHKSDIEQSANAPKIEIIQRAIIFIKEFDEENSQLKSEILALQVKLGTQLAQKDNKKDASTQVTKVFNTKLNSSKFNKLAVIKKCKHDALKCDAKKITKTNVVEPTETVKTSEIATKVTSNPKPISQVHNLPLILPKPINNIKRQPENTIVVLPAPYMLPPRPLIFPAAPPAFVLLDPNPQPSTCKGSIPVLTRNGSEVTKTTMVNIVPISAYSHPLSLINTKNNVKKSKIDASKRNIKQPKKTKKLPSKCKETDTVPKQVETEKKPEDEVMRTDDQKKSNDNIDTSNGSSVKDTSESIDCINVKETTDPKTHKEKNSDACLDAETLKTNDNNVNNILLIDDNAKDLSNNDRKRKLDNNDNVNANNDATNSVILNGSLPQVSKSSETKTIEEKITCNKEKEKFPPLLETSLCESTVDGGNARLELAEELLAASPTAAFLMSFPLVSGNRADSPADETSTAQSGPTRETPQRPSTLCVETPQPDTFYSKTQQIDNKTKITNKLQSASDSSNKGSNPDKIRNSNLENKAVYSKGHLPIPSVSIENQFSSASASIMPVTTCSITDTTFSFDFDCNSIKNSIANTTSSYVSGNNFFYNKNDPFNTVKNTIYSSSNITSGHDFNSLGLYPCAMEKYSSKNKADYSNVEENLIKIGSSRLTYDIDLGWPHKTFEFGNCTTTSNNFSKDNIFTTVPSTFSTFNHEFHVNLGSTPSKKDASVSNKSNTNYAESITNFYSQPTNFWPDEIPFYGNNNISSTKSLMTKPQTYLSTDQAVTNIKQNNEKMYNSKISDHNNSAKTSNHNTSIPQQLSDKYTKKSPNKMHINWMTSETRPVQNNICSTSISDIKEKPYSGHPQHSKKQDHAESYFPIQINSHLPTQIPQEDYHVWPSSRPLGTTEISIEPPPINLPTLVGDLALGPHDRKKNDHGNRGAIINTDLTNCNNFLSVTQLMNRSSENMSRYPNNNEDLLPKSLLSKQNVNQYSNDISRKTAVPRYDSNYIQSYTFEDKLSNYDTVTQFSHTKSKANKSSSEKFSKSHKNNYSAEALIRGGTQKIEPPKFVMPTQKYNNFNAVHDGSVAQVSHFAPILDYTDNTSQQLGSSHLYSSTTSTISNSFYSNFMPTSSNLMSSNYPTSNFPGDFIEYNQGVDCNYGNQKYEEFKMRNNPPIITQDKIPTTGYRNSSSRRETTTKHKLECSKKDTAKKYTNKKAKLNTEIDDWSDPSHLLWQNRSSSKKHGNLVPDEISFPNYAGNQGPMQYQSEFFNSHLMPTNVQGMTHNVDKSIPSFPGTSRANFNLSSIFPEITMKVQ